MRKVKIFLTTLAIAGVLFATSSCVDNTESESVAGFRDAKANELNAQATYLKAKADYLTAQAEWDLIVAKAEAGLRDAQAQAERDKGTQLIAYGEADKIRAQAEKIRAQADSLESDGQKELLYARANALEVRAQAYADSVKEVLRLTQWQNEKLIAQAKEDIREIGLKAAATIIQLRAAYLQLAGHLDLVAAKRYADLVDSVYYAQKEVNQLDADIRAKEVEIADVKLRLTAYLSDYGDSALFVNKYIADTKAKIVAEQLKLQYAEKQIAYWEDYDVLTPVKDDSAKLVQDTIDAYNAINELLANIEVVEGAIEANDDILASAKTAYNTAIGAAVAAEQRLRRAEEDYTKYIDLTAGLHRNSNYSSWSNVPSITVNSRNYTTAIFPDYDADEIPLDIQTLIEIGFTGSVYGYFNNDSPYTYRDGVNMVDIVYYRTILYYFDNGEIYETDDRSQWRAYYLNVGTFESQYTSIYDLNYKIAEEENLIAEKRDEYKADSLALKNNLDSVSKYLSGTTGVIAAKRDLDAKQAAYEVAESAWNAAGNPSSGTVFNRYNLALGEFNDAQTVYNYVKGKFDEFNGYIFSLINAKIDSKSAYEDAQVHLKELISYRTILETGTRDKLRIAVDDAKRAYKAELDKQSYKDAVDAYEDATTIWNVKDFVLQDSLINLNAKVEPAEEELECLIDEYNTKIVEYNYWINYGGDSTLIAKKAKNIATYTKDKLTYEQQLAQYEKELAEVTKYATDSKGINNFFDPDGDGPEVANNVLRNGLVTAVIKAYNDRLASLDRIVKQLEKERLDALKVVEYTEKALTSFVNALGTIDGLGSGEITLSE
jgi:hypothetical protein